MKTRHIQQGGGCFPRIMEESEGLCLPTVLPSRGNSEKSSGRNDNNNFRNSIMARAAMVPKGTTNEYSEPNNTPKNRILIARSRLPKTLSDGKQIITVNIMDSFRKKLVAEGLSEKAISLISYSRRKDTVNH